MRRIIIHWTVGRYKQLFPEHYHFMIDDVGNIKNGKYTPEDNENCGDKKYAQHTGGGNTGSIGVALCAMFGFKSIKDVGAYPITKKQFEACCELCARLCRKYNIKIAPDTVLTHYEFGLTHPKTTSRGKIDIIYLPPYPEVKQAEVGDFIRRKISWYFNKT